MGSTKKLGGLLWFNVILFGFIGQIAWAVENIYFNTFLFDKIGASHEKISLMVSASAVTAMVTTLIMGALSDKLNRRKLFLSGGYIIWGLSVCVFAFISRESIGKLFGLTETAAVVAATVSIVIVMDCVMTFFGSTSNDAAFNAWVTDVTDVSNRGTVESVLALLAVFATVVVSVVFGLLVEGVGYSACFIGLGLLVTVCGILGLFTVKDSLSGEKKQESYWKDLTYGFRPAVIKENRSLYISLAATAVFTTAVQVFMPYIFIYLEHYLRFSFGSIQITPTGAIIAAAVVGALVAGMILLGRMIDRLGKSRFAMISVTLFVTGLVCLSQAKKLGTFGLFAVLMFGGYGLLTIILNASIRDFTPEGMAGRFQGIRMIFMVLIPMVVGPAVGSRVISAFSVATYLNEYKEKVKIPVPHIYLAAAVIGVFVLVPLLFVRDDFKGVNEKKTGRSGNKMLVIVAAALLVLIGLAIGNFALNNTNRSFTTLEQAGIGEDAGVTLISSHGLSSLAPENSTDAFVLAAENGYAGVQFEARCTADGIWVVFRDDDLRRTTDGKGKIDGITYKQLLQCRVDKGSGIEKYDNTPLTVPTLNQALSVCAKNNLMPVVEIKQSGTNRLEALFNAVGYRYKKACVLVFSDDKQVAKATELLESGSVNLKKENVELCRYVKKLDDNALETAEKTPDVTVCFPADQKSADEAFKRFANAGLKLFAWSVNKPEQARALVAAGVTRFTTDVLAYREIKTEDEAETESQVRTTRPAATKPAASKETTTRPAATKPAASKETTTRPAAAETSAVVKGGA